MKKILSFVVALSSICGFVYGQFGTIDFDDASKWIAGSGGITSYQTDHVYADQDWTFTGGPALRQGSGTTNDFPSTLGTYSWRLRDNTPVSWTATLGIEEQVTEFSFAVRRWRATPEVNYTVEYSVNGGDEYTNTGIVINNAFLGNTNDWSTFSYTIDDPVVTAPGQFIVRLTQSSGERIMVDDFSYTYFSELGPRDEPTNHPTGFTCVSPTFESLDLEWTGSVGDVIPDGYLIKWSDVSYGAISDPVDGNPESGANVLNVGHEDGLNTIAITGLAENTTYFFKIWPYTNGGSSIDYKVGDEPRTSCATTSPYTLPELHDLSSGDYSFTEWSSSAAAGTYPSNMRFHFIGSEQTGATTAEVSSFDFTCDYNLSARSRFRGNGSEGFSMFNTNASQNSDCSGTGLDRFTGLAVLGLNTTGQSNIAVSWIGRTISDNSSVRDYRIILQYRLGAEGTWTTVNTGEFYRYSGIEGAEENNTSGSSAALNQLLPTACENQSEVYLRWLYYQEVAIGGNRPELGVDDILVEAGVVTPTINDEVCGLTNVLANQEIIADPVIGATAYRFRVDNGSVVQVITKTANSFLLSELDAVPYNATVSVQVAVEVDGSFTPYGDACTFETVPLFAQLRSPDCSRILRLMSQMVYANYVGADEYAFEITNLVTSEVQVLTKSVRGFSLIEIENPFFGTQYQVRVRLVIAGVTQEFGNPCVITSPGSTAQLRSADCGRELINFDDVVYAIPLDADLWRFEVSNDFNQDVQVIESNSRELSFSQVNTQITGITYFVRVQIEENGVVQPYGNVCQVIAPTVRAQLRSADCGKQLVSFAHLSYANVTSADLWIFELTNTATMEFEVVEKNNRSIRLSDLSNPSNNVTYDVRVRVVINGVLQPYGRTCTLLAPVVGESLVVSTNELDGLSDEEQLVFRTSVGSLMSEVLDQRFTAYPNPTATSFRLAPKYSLETGDYSIIVVDAAGRLIEQLNLTQDEVEQVLIGGDYAPGIYVVNVRNKREIYQVRLVKR